MTKKWVLSEFTFELNVTLVFLSTSCSLIVVIPVEKDASVIIVLAAYIPLSSRPANAVLLIPF